MISHSRYNYYYYYYSIFDGNHVATDGAIVDVYYEHARFDNVTFTNQQGVVLRVSFVYYNVPYVTCV